MDDAQLAEIRSLHYGTPSERGNPEYCQQDGQRMLCDMLGVIAALEASRAECARLRQLLEDRQRYIHCEIHVDAQHIPLGYWKDCQKPTCMDTAAALNGAADATVGSATTDEPIPGSRQAFIKAMQERG